MLAHPHIEMQAGRVEDAAPLLASAMRLDEEALAGEGKVGDEVLLGFLTCLLQDLQLLRQFQWGVLAQLDIQDQRVDVIDDNRRRRWHTTSQTECPSWNEFEQGPNRPTFLDHPLVVSPFP